MAKTPTVLWTDAPEADDYPAAYDFLSLIMREADAAALVKKLKKGRLVRRKAKDILRASGVMLLPRDNPRVARNLKKVRQGRPLSPVLLVRGDRAKNIPLTIADGYHRISAGWYVDENALIPCRLV
jgi:hypothetical protein